MQPHDTTFHVYALCRVDGSPFYIGKARDGRRSRLSEHEVEARSKHHCHKCHVIRKIWESGGVLRCTVLYRTPDEADAYRIERALIAAIGRELLTNATDGGEGLTGRTGELSGQAKLTWVKVVELRKRYAEETTPVRVLAAEYGVSLHTVELIVAEKSWKTGDAPLKRDPAIRIANSPKGEQQWEAKLTWELVREIRTLYPASGIPTDVIATRYDVSQRVIYLVLCNESWHDPSYDPSVYVRAKPRASGERNHGAVLTWPIVREIRARYVFRKVTAKMLAVEYGITANHVEKIIRREMWREV